MRTEQEIFTDLEALCKSDGYIHVIAYLCWEQNFLLCHNNKVVAEDLLEQNNISDRYVKNEISALLGLMCKFNINYLPPNTTDIKNLVEKTKKLLTEMHGTIKPDLRSNFMLMKENPLKCAKILRESFFYGTESAYDFQYRDFSIERYNKDEKWFIENKGYTINEAVILIKSIIQYQQEKSNNIVNNKLLEYNYLTPFILSIDDILNRCDISKDKIKAFLNSFSIKNNCNKNYNNITSFNEANAYPIIKKSANEYIILQPYSLVSALYTTPFYWFNNDKTYKNEAMSNRGSFTEEFSAKRLKKIFGKNKVFCNIDIVNKKGNKEGEIDVLVVFADRAIILQAKSKMLTIAARQGNDDALINDFTKAIQEAYNQGLSCAKLLSKKDTILKDSSGNILNINRNVKEKYIFCITSEYYPALFTQSRLFLKYETNEHIMPPFIMDVFLLDAMTEMLCSPLHFLSYIRRRSLYFDKICSGTELEVLAYHLKNNLYLSGIGGIYLDNQIAHELDIAMATRRNGINGNPVPDGILTRYKNTHFDSLIKYLESQENNVYLELGFLLLSIDTEVISQINNYIDNFLINGRTKNHLILQLSDQKTWLSIHCNNLDQKTEKSHLIACCQRMKDLSNADSLYCFWMHPRNIRKISAVYITSDNEIQIKMSG